MAVPRRVRAVIAAALLCRPRDFAQAPGDGSSGGEPAPPLLASATQPPDASPGKDVVCLREQKLCKYGAHCYQKNPSHFTQFFHPHLMKEL